MHRRAGGDRHDIGHDICLATQAAQPSPFTDDPVRVAVEQFLLRETAGLPGKASIQVVPPSGGRARECVAPQPFLPGGAAAWGRVSVGVRCGGERPWTRYVQARVSVVADYYVAAHALAPGQPIRPADLERREGDLAGLPRAVVTDPAQLQGAVTANRIAAGSPLRMDMVRKAIAVKQGQMVAVTIEGEASRFAARARFSRTPLRATPCRSGSRAARSSTGWCGTPTRWCCSNSRRHGPGLSHRHSVVTACHNSRPKVWRRPAVKLSKPSKDIP